MPVHAGCTWIGLSLVLFSAACTRPAESTDHTTDVAGQSTTAGWSAPWLAPDQLTGRQRTHGNRQVRHMLRDRPVMARFKTEDGQLAEIRPDDAIWQWVASGFGTPENGQLIQWDGGPMDKPSHYHADHTIPEAMSPGQIRVLARFSDLPGGPLRDATFDEMWSSVIYELINIRNARSFLEVYEEALTGTVDRNQWVYRNTRLEYEALVELRHFYQHIWQPWAASRGYRGSPEPWQQLLAEDYESWIQQYQVGDHNPYLFWENYYDNQLVPYLESLNR